MGNEPKDEWRTIVYGSNGYRVSHFLTQDMMHYVHTADSVEYCDSVILDSHGTGVGR